MDWSDSQIKRYEKAVDLVLKNDHSFLQENKLREFDLVEEDYEEFLFDLITYWAWKDTYKIDIILSRIKNPNLRLLRLMRFGFSNNRQAKFYLKFKKFDFPEKVANIIEDVNQTKARALIKMFLDKGTSLEFAKKQVDPILATYYGWAENKDDLIRNDLQKANIFKFYKNFLFPGFFDSPDQAA